MSIQTYELEDGRHLGCCVLEVTAFPEIDAVGSNRKENLERNRKLFQQIIKEIHVLIADGGIAIELLWFTQPVKSQAVKSVVRAFLVLRRIGHHQHTVSNELEHLQDNLHSSLTAAKFGIEKLDPHRQEFQDALAKVNSSCVYSIVKTDRCIANANSMYPYYSVDVLPQSSADNFESLLSAMSQYQDCAVSFQLFPTRVTQREAAVLNEMTAELNRIFSGIHVDYQLYRDPAAKAPFEVLNYYNNHRNAPLFQFNVLVFGSRPACASLTAKVIGLLQSGESAFVSPELASHDLSGSGLDLSQMFMAYPFNLNSQMIYSYQQRDFVRKLPMVAALSRLPHILTDEEATAFFRLPLREKSMIALKGNLAQRASEQFEPSVIAENNIWVGSVDVGRGDFALEIGCPGKAFTKHALIVGTPGTGKTTFSINLLMQFHKKDIPFLAIEPTKKEYRALIDAVDDLQVFTPGNNDVSPFIINPFIPPRGVKLEQYIPSLVSAFQAAFSMQQPLDMLFLKAVRESYAEFGWKDYSTVSDEGAARFGLHEFIRVFKKLVDESNYEARIKGNLQSAGVLRLMNLIEQNSNIYDTIHTIPIEDLLSKPTVLELNSIENAEQKSLLMALLLINVCTFTKHNHITEGGLRNIILIDEAHVLFGSDAVGVGEADPVNITTKALQDMVAEIRAYGTGIIIADQSPSKVGRGILANTDIKVAFRLVEESERKLFAGSFDSDLDIMKLVSRLKVGEAFFYFNQLQEPQLVKTPDVRDQLDIRLGVPDDEIARRASYWESHSELLIPFNECRYSEACSGGCQFRVRADAEHYAVRYLREYGNKINDATSLYTYITLVDKWLETRQRLDPASMDKRLTNCTKIRLARKAILQKNLTISEANIEKMLVKALSL